MTAQAFAGIDIRAASGGLLFRAFLQDSVGAILATGTTTLRLYELQTDGSLKSYDFTGDTFKTTALTAPTLALTHRTGNNTTYSTGIWSVALTTLTGFTAGSIYFAEINNAGASPPDQVREFQYGSGVLADVQQWLGATPLALSDQKVQAAASVDLGAAAPANWIDAASVQADAVTKIQAGLATPTNITAAAGITLADDAITAAKFDESTAFPLKSADSGATYVARAPSGTETLDTLAADIAAVSTAVVSGVASTLKAVASVETTGVLISGTFASTELSNGTYMTIGPAAVAVAEVGTAGTPFGLNETLRFTAASGQFVNSITIRGFFNAAVSRFVNVYAYNCTVTPRVWDQLSDSATRMNHLTAIPVNPYGYGISSSHQKATEAVVTTFAGSAFSAAGTTVTANVTGHGFVTGDIVTISGITTLTNANGVKMVTRVTDDQFTYLIATQTATGGGTATMSTDPIGTVRVGFKSSSITINDRLNIDQCLVNVGVAGPSAADIAAAVYTKMLPLKIEGIWIDTVNGVDANDGYTNATPVLTIAQAYLRCAAANVKRIYFNAGSNVVPVVLTQSAAGWRFIGPGKIDLGSQNIADAIFDGCYSVYGISTGDDATFLGGGLGSGGITLDHHYLKGVMLKGAITLIANADPIILQNCIDATGAGADFELIFVANATAVVRNFQGAVTLKGMAATNSVVIDGACRVTIDASCTGGSITLRGFADAPAGAAAFVAAGGTIIQTARYATDQIMAEGATLTKLATMVEATP